MSEATDETCFKLLCGSQEELTTIIKDITDDYLDTATYTEDLTVIWEDLRDKYHIPAESKMDELGTYYHLVNLKDTE